MRLLPRVASLGLAVDATADGALSLAGALADAAAFQAAWDGFAEGWEARWLDAFTPRRGPLLWCPPCPDCRGAGRVCVRPS